MPKVITLPCYDIRVTVEGQSGSIESDLKKGKGLGFIDAAVDGMLSLVLACACAGIDIETPAFIEAIETAVDAIGNQ